MVHFLGVWTRRDHRGTNAGRMMILQEIVGRDVTVAADRGQSTS